MARKSPRLNTAGGLSLFVWFDATGGLVGNLWRLPLPTQKAPIRGLVKIMNRSAQILFLLDTPGLSAQRCARLQSAFVLLFLLVCSALPARAGTAKGGSNNSPRSAVGTLKVWVPAGVIGDDYWLYVDGKIVSAPPHNSLGRGERNYLVMATGVLKSQSKRGDGWQIVTNQNHVLKMHNAEFENLGSFLQSENESREVLSPPLFQAVELRLPPGKYNVELAIFSPGNIHGLISGTPSSFPFAITPKIPFGIQSAHTTEFHLAVPDEWSENVAPIALPEHRVCPDRDPSPPDRNQLERWLKDYTDDPIVMALGEADSTSQNVIVLDLPLTRGGKREFDGCQIRYITDAILASHNVPDHAEIEECRSLFPQYSQAYAGYDKAISTIVTKDIEQFRALAARLAAGR
jgi:hypothetical protein